MGICKALKALRNDEARMTNNETMTKCEIRNGPFVLWACFRIRISDFIRHSSFVIRHFST
jgi:hypothetical protein